jgi:hypothetical protein
MPDFPDMIQFNNDLYISASNVQNFIDAYYGVDVIPKASSETMSVLVTPEIRFHLYTVWNNPKIKRGSTTEICRLEFLNPSNLIILKLAQSDYIKDYDNLPDHFIGPE